MLGGEAARLDRHVLLDAARVDALVDRAVAHELARDADRLVDVAAGVAAQVEHDRVRAVGLGALDGVLDALGGAGRELVEPDHGDLASGDHRPADQRQVELLADDLDVERVGAAALRWSG